MKVRMKVQITGPRNGVDWPAPGGEIVVPDLEGAELCANGMADPVAVVAPIETRSSEVPTEPKPRRRVAK